jgi:hypothetical protein
MFAVLGMSMTAAAETITVIKVNTPFAVTFGDHTFPAGDYSLTQPLQHVLTSRNARGQVLGSALTDAVDSPTPGASTKVKFNSVTGQHVLSEVWQDHETSGGQLAHTKARTQMAVVASTTPTSPKQIRQLGDSRETICSCSRRTSSLLAQLRSGSALASSPLAGQPTAGSRGSFE